MKQRNKWSSGMVWSTLLIAMLGVTGCSTVVEDVEPDGVSAALVVRYVVHEDSSVTALPDVTLWYTYPDVDPEPNGFLWFHGDTEVNQLPGSRALLEDASVQFGGMTLEYADFDEVSNRTSFELPAGATPTFTDGDDVALEVSVEGYEVSGTGGVHLPEFVMLRIPAVGAVRSPGQSVVVYRFVPGWNYNFTFRIKYPDFGWSIFGAGQHYASMNDDAHEWWFDLPPGLVADSIRLDIHQFTDRVDARFSRAWAIVPPEETP